MTTSKASKSATTTAAKKAAEPRAKPAVKKAAVKKAATKKAAAKKAAATMPPAKKAGTGHAAQAGAITPKQALANTRALLEAKQAHARQAPAWQALDTRGSQVPQPGFQSDEARIKADELHAGESRMAAIEGSISTQDRHQQGKRDGR